MPIVSGPATKVLVIAYIGYTPTITPTQLAQELVSYIYHGTMFHGVQPSSISFEIVGSRVEISNTRPPKRTQDKYWDMWKIYADHNICNRMIAESIDEVWVIIDGNDKDPNYVWGWEWQVNGPLFSTSEATSAYPPNCGKQVYTLGFNFNATSDYALESWLHSAEFAFSLPESGSGLQSCDFGHPGYYGMYGNFSDDDCNAIGYSDTSGFTVLPDYTHGYAGVCGDAHYPPNIPREHASPPLPNPHAYIYWDTTAYSSRCTDWQWNILTNTVPISCGVWGCNKGSYHT
jgi:hypothetical protein